jgi:hypothetical protein
MLMSSNGPRITPEGSGHIVLVGPTLLYEVDHRVRLGHAIAERVLREDHAGPENNALIILGPDQTAVVDDNGARWRRGREKIVLSDRIRHGVDGTHGE